MADRLHLDVETYSEADLKAGGVYRYAEHPSTELLVVCYAFDEEEVETWVPEDDPFVPERVREHIESGGLVFAHNAQFERVVLNGVAGQKVNFPRLRIAQMRCTAAKMAAHGLPRALEDAAEALDTHRKQADGRGAMLQLTKPRRAGAVSRWTRENAPFKFAQLDSYCADDVRAERGIDRVVPDLSSSEQRVYELDQLINDRGIAADRQSVRDAIALIDSYKAELEQKCLAWTGYKPTQRDRIADWVRANGYARLADLQKDTVAAAVADPACPRHTADVLALYSTYNSKAVSKYDAIEAAICDDGRLHGMFLYHGAATARWSSLLVQLQNLLRPPPDFEQDAVIDTFWMRDVETLRDLYPELNPIKTLGSCIRGMLVAGEEREIQSLDFSGVEARVNAWVFDETWKLDAFRAFDAGTGPDLYRLAYARAFRVPVDTVTKDQRQVGKGMELYLGYQGGAGAFKKAAATGLDLDAMASEVLPVLEQDTVEQALWMLDKFGSQGLHRDTFIACDGLKQLWRRAHPRIKEGWKLLHESAALAIRHPGDVYGLPNKKIQFCLRDRWLYMRLPSGRKLAYYRPEVNDQDEITYMGVDTDTRRWMRTHAYGGRFCENASQAISRDLLVHALFNLEAAGVQTVGTVHDEIISDVRPTDPSFEECRRLMCSLPGWAAGLPVAAEGFRGRRYKK